MAKKIIETSISTPTHIYIYINIWITAYVHEINHKLVHASKSICLSVCHVFVLHIYIHPSISLIYISNNNNYRHMIVTICIHKQNSFYCTSIQFTPIHIFVCKERNSKQRNTQTHYCAQLQLALSCYSC
jgi:hypothetical protein